MWFCEKSRWFCLCRFLSRQNVKFCSVVHWKSAIVISNTVTQSFDRKTGISSLVWNHFLFTNPFAADFSVDRHASCNTSINGTIWRQFKNLTHFELCESIDRNDWHPKSSSWPSFDSRMQTAMTSYISKISIVAHEDFTSIRSLFTNKWLSRRHTGI